MTMTLRAPPNETRPDPMVPATLLRAPDGTLKVRWDGKRFAGSVESVWIPHPPRRSTVCISTQSGCARGCSFCATGTMPQVRSLTAEEIEQQVAHAIRHAESVGGPPVRNLVFMGMGEPLDNPRAVSDALRVLVDPRRYAMAPRHITISSVGPSPRAIHRAISWPGRFAWSLHAAEDSVRRCLIPTARHSVQALRDAWAHVCEARRQPLFLEMALVEDLNDSVRAAEAAAALMDGFPQEVRFNLMPVNPNPRGHRPPPVSRVRRFHDILREAGFRALVRRPRGQDRRAACGQLVTLRS